MLACLRGGDLGVALREVLLGRHRLAGAGRSKETAEVDLAAAADISPRSDRVFATRQSARREQRRLGRGHDCSPNRSSCVGGAGSTADGYGPEGSAMR